MPQPDCSIVHLEQQHDGHPRILRRRGRPCTDRDLAAGDAEEMNTPTKDCPTCKWSRNHDCCSPKYAALNDFDRGEFWSDEKLARDCDLWEPWEEPKK